MILGEMEITGYPDATAAWVSAAEVESNDEDKPCAQGDRRAGQGRARCHRIRPTKQGETLRAGLPIPAIRLESRAHKMSKSRGNVVNPDMVVHEYGADCAAAVRNVHGTAGSRQALEHGRRQRRARLFGPRMADDRRRAKRAASSSTPPCRMSSRRPTRTASLHKTIQGVTHDFERMAFNTAIAKMMEFTNYFLKCARAAASGDGEAGAAAVTVRAAHRRRTVAAAGPRQDAGL